MLATASFARIPHGSCVQLIPHYYSVEDETGLLSFTADGLAYYQRWYAKHGRQFPGGPLTLQSFKAELLTLVGESLDEEVRRLEHDVSKGRATGLEARVAGELLQANFAQAAEYATLARRARENLVVELWPDLSE